MQQLNGVPGGAPNDLVDLIESRRSQMIDAYMSGLTAAGSAAGRDTETLEQAVANAERVLSALFAGLRTGEPPADEGYGGIVPLAGETRTHAAPHPSESIEASSILFQAVLSTVVHLLPPEPEALKTCELIAVTLERSIGLRTRQSLLAYVSLLLRRVHEAQIGERRRIARELHDRIGHGLSVTHLQLELFDLYRDSDPATAFTKADTARKAIHDSIRQLRDITSELHAREPVRSLKRALVSYLETADTEGVAVLVRVHGDEGWAPTEVLDESFLILREAARNALRHAKASLLVVHVDISPDELIASVEDDGCGFDATEPLRSNGLGLSVMAERAALLGGAVRLTSAASRGTQVRYSVPLGGRGRDDAAG